MLQSSEFPTGDKQDEEVMRWVGMQSPDERLSQGEDEEMKKTPLSPKRWRRDAYLSMAQGKGKVSVRPRKGKLLWSPG